MYLAHLRWHGSIAVPCTSHRTLSQGLGWGHRLALKGLAQHHSILALVVSFVLPILLAKLVKRELRRHASVSQFERSLIFYNANVLTTPNI